MSAKKILRRTRILNYEPMITRLPMCSASVTSTETITWRERNDRCIRKAERLGVDLMNCFQTATYKIGDRWFCRKHAALIALDMLAEDP